MNQAIRVNEFMETSVPDIYAAGDCATARMINFELETHAPLALKANKQVMIGGINLAGVRDSFRGVMNTSVTKVFDPGVARTGLSFEQAEKLNLAPKKIIIHSKDRARYYPGSSPLTSILIVSKKSREVLAAQLAGKLESMKRIDD